MRSLPILLGLVCAATYVWVCWESRLEIVERARAEVERRRMTWGK